MTGPSPRLRELLDERDRLRGQMIAQERHVVAQLPGDVGIRAIRAALSGDPVWVERRAAWQNARARVEQERDRDAVALNRRR